MAVQNDSMTIKDKVDCLIELHKEQSLKHKQLIDLEFKINIALWSLIAFAGYFILKEVLPNLTKITICQYSIGYFFLSGLVLTFHYNLWLFPIVRSQVVSDYFIKSYLCEIERLAEYSISTNTSKSKPDIKCFCDFPQKYRNWIRAEAGITVLLLGLIFLIGLSQKI